MRCHWVRTCASSCNYKVSIEFSNFPTGSAKYSTELDLEKAWSKYSRAALLPIGVRSVSLLAIIPSPITLFAIHHYRRWKKKWWTLNGETTRKTNSPHENRFEWIWLLRNMHGIPRSRWLNSLVRRLGEADGEGGIELDSNIFQLNFPPPSLQPLLFRFVFLLLTARNVIIRSCAQHVLPLASRGLDILCIVVNLI